MAEFTEVMKQKIRLCESFTFDYCKGCPLGSSYNGRGKNCQNFVKDYPEEAEQMIMDWAKENPVKTNADKFKEVFGFELDMVEISEVTNGCILKCGETKLCEECVKYNFWKQEYKEREV